MSEISHTDLIAEAEARVNANRIGLSWARETDRDLLVIKRLIAALGTAVTALTETEADLQVSRAREKVLRAVIERVAIARSNHPVCEEHPDGDPISCGWKRAVIDIDAALTAAPSPTLEAVKADAWDEGKASGMSRAMRRMSDEPHLSLEIPNPYRPVSTEGDSRG